MLFLFFILYRELWKQLTTVSTVSAVSAVIKWRFQIIDMEKVIDMKKTKTKTNRRRMSTRRSVISFVEEMVFPAKGKTVGACGFYAAYSKHSERIGVHISKDRFCRILDRHGHPELWTNAMLGFPQSEENRGEEESLQRRTDCIDIARS